jgi:hypothetical protein
VTSEPIDLPRLVLRRVALLRGLDDDEIGRLRRRGAWTPLQRGAYLEGGSADLTREARHLLAVRATTVGLRTPAVLSHASAAVLHGLPVWGIPLARVHITRRPPARSDTGARLRSHVARLPDDHITVVGEHAVTTVARTVVDLAACLPFAPALAVADAALRAGTPPEDLRGALDFVAGTRGTRAARRVVEAADRRSESVGESRSRAVMLQLGLPRPDLQVEVRSPDGRLIGRSDFGWRKQRVLGEFDGLIKYGRLLRPGQDAGDAVFEEKRREDALRDEDWGMVRWIWCELDTPVILGRRIARRLGISPS